MDGATAKPKDLYNILSPDEGLSLNELRYALMKEGYEIAENFERRMGLYLNALKIAGMAKSEAQEHRVVGLERSHKIVFTKTTDEPAPSLVDIVKKASKRGFVSAKNSILDFIP